MAERQIKYSSVATGERLYQGEIVADLVQARQSLDSIGTEKFGVQEIIRPYAIVLTQECDLEQDSKKRTETGTGPVENVLFCPAYPTSDLKQSAHQTKKYWDLITQNRDIRYQCIEEIPAAYDSMARGIPSLACDFKVYFTVSTDEVYKRIHLGQIVRRSRLITPYAEHLLHRFCDFQARIPLPQNHDVPI